MLDGAVSQLKSEAKLAKANDWRSDWNLFKVSKAKFKISEPNHNFKRVQCVMHCPKLLIAAVMNEAQAEWMNKSLIWQAEKSVSRSKNKIYPFIARFLCGRFISNKKSPWIFKGFFIKVFRLLISHQHGLLCLKRQPFCV